MSNYYRWLSMYPAALYGFLLLISFATYLVIEPVLGGSRDCKHTIMITCIRGYLRDGETALLIVTAFVVLDAILILLISLGFCITYQKFLEKLKAAYGNEDAEQYWQASPLVHNACAAAATLALLFPFWIGGHWVTYSFLLFILYFLFILSNAQLIELLSTEAARNFWAHQELYVDILSIAREENLHSFFAYACLFLVAAFAYILITSFGGESSAELIMRGFLAGAATVHLCLSFIKVSALMDKQTGIGALVAKAAVYRMAPNDQVCSAGAQLRSDIRVRARRYWRVVGITWIVIGLALFAKLLTAWAVPALGS